MPAAATPSGASGRKRGLLPLPRTRNCASESNTSSSFKPNTSAERSPCRSIKPTMAKSRAVRKLDQKRATSSTDSGTRLRLGTLSQPTYRHARPAQAQRPSVQKSMMEAAGHLAGGVGELVAQGAIGDGDAPCQVARGYHHAFLHRRPL